MKPGYIRTAIERQLQPHLLRLGFGPKIAGNKPDELLYRKPFKGGFQSCIFSILEHEDVCHVELSMGVRIDVVEMLANQFNLTLEDYYSETHTILTSYGRMMDKRHFRFKISDEAQLNTARLEMQHFLLNTGIPFLNRVNSVYQMDRLINDYPERPSKYIYNQSDRCIKGLIIARICHNPHFGTLAKAYDFILQRHSLSESMMPSYRRLVDHLRFVSVN